MSLVKRRTSTNPAQESKMYWKYCFQIPLATALNYMQLANHCARHRGKYKDV